MNYASIAMVGGIVAVIGLVIGVLLGIAAKKFAVEIDQKEIDVRACLPGNNCGACGFAGCDALAKQIAAGEAPVGACPVGGDPVAAQIGKIMGVAAEAGDKQVAFVKCAGTCEKTENKYNYYGLADCRDIVVAPGRGGKKCDYGCLGFGSCVKVCDFDAIHVVNGIAVVDRETCKGCKKCMEVCPKGIIEMFTIKATQAVRCSSHDKGKQVKSACDTGCIACKACTKVCESGAITVEGNLAHIDQDKCTGCGKCAEKCPQKIICVPNELGKAVAKAV